MTSFCYGKRMLSALTVAVLLCAAAAVSAAQKQPRQVKSQDAGYGLSPMEARLEREAGNKDAKSTRIDNAKRASRKIRKAVAGAQEVPDGTRTRHVKVDKDCRGRTVRVTPCDNAKCRK